MSDRFTYGFWSGWGGRNFDESDPKRTALLDLIESLKGFDNPLVALGLDPDDKRIQVAHVDSRAEAIRNFMFLFSGSFAEFDDNRRLLERVVRKAHHQILGYEARAQWFNSIFTGAKEWGFIAIYLWSPWIFSALFGTITVLTSQQLSAALLKPDSPWQSFATTGFFALLSSMTLFGAIFRKSNLVIVSVLLTTLPVALFNVARTEGSLKQFEAEVSRSGVFVLLPVAGVLGVFFGVVFARILAHKMTVEAVDELIEDLLNLKPVKSVRQSKLITTPQQRFPGGATLIFGIALAIVSIFAVLRLFSASTELRQKQQQERAKLNQTRLEQERQQAVAKSKRLEEELRKAKDDQAKLLEAKNAQELKLKSDLEELERKHSVAAANLPRIDNFEAYSKYATDQYKDDYVPFQDPQVVIAWDMENIDDAAIEIDGKPVMRITQRHGAVLLKPERNRASIRLVALSQAGTKIEREALWQNIPTNKTVDQFFASLRREKQSMGSDE